MHLLWFRLKEPLRMVRNTRRRVGRSRRRRAYGRWNWGVVHTVIVDTVHLRRHCIQSYLHRRDPGNSHRMRSLSLADSLHQTQYLGELGVVWHATDWLVYNGTNPSRTRVMLRAAQFSADCW